MGQVTRIAMGVVTAGASELFQKKPFQPWERSDPSLGAIGRFATDPIHGLAKAAGRLTKRPSPPQLLDTAPSPQVAEAQVQARNAAARRRKEFQNLGRSSTLLTGPGGLGGTGAGEQKTLLGY